MTEVSDNPPDPAGPHPIGVGRIFAAFLRLGITAFGGNIAGWLHRDIVVRRGWIDDRTFLADFAMGQAIPGSNGIKLTVQIGQRLPGAGGFPAGGVEPQIIANQDRGHGGAQSSSTAGPAPGGVVPGRVRPS